MSKTHLTLVGVGAIALSSIATEAKAQYTPTDVSPRRLPTLSISTSNGATCSGGGGSQPTFNIGSGYGRNGELQIGAVLVIPLGDNTDRCKNLIALEEKRSKLQYLGDLLDIGLLSEEEFKKKVKQERLLELS